MCCCCDNKLTSEYSSHVIFMSHKVTAFRSHIRHFFSTSLIEAMLSFCHDDKLCLEPKQ
jgi:hypothetical protein